MSIDIKNSYWLFLKIHHFINKLPAESDILMLKNRVAFFKFLSHKNISVYVLQTQYTYSSTHKTSPVDMVLLKNTRKFFNFLSLVILTWMQFNKVFRENDHLADMKFDRHKVKWLISHSNFICVTYMRQHYKKNYHTTVSEVWCLWKPKWIKKFNESYELKTSNIYSFIASYVKQSQSKHFNFYGSEFIYKQLIVSETWDNFLGT